MTPTYPLFLDLRDRRALVVGGGPVAARRTSRLLESGARVTVVAPALCEDLAELASSGRVEWRSREYVPSDIDEVWLVHTATGDPRTDEAVAAAAETHRIWCDRADDAAASAAWTPAVAPGPDGVIIAVNGGRDPRRARAIRNAISLGLASGALPVRRRRRDATTGSVHLVGGGPGPDDLLTVRGRQLLALADVVVVDRLAPRGVLSELAADVEIIDAGKSPGRHQLTQEQINLVIVERAQRGLRVVRLKGGDPYVLGRGAEEAIACRAAGVPVEVVPGVTSAISVPAAAGIPVTHRGTSASFAVISAHEGLTGAAASGAETLVLLMGITRLDRSVATFLAAGRPATTPVAIIERGWSAEQRTTVGTLADIVELARKFEVVSPAVVVVGDVVNVRHELADAMPRSK